jgi:Ni/Co efflux regulator RcnB
MKKIITTLLISAAMVSGAAFAQGAPDHGGPQHGGPGPGGHGGPQQMHGGGNPPVHGGPGPMMHGGPGPSDWHRKGGRLPNDYRDHQYVVDNYGEHHLNRPPRGYHWVGVNGDYMLVAITSGVIAQIITGR